MRAELTKQAQKELEESFELNEDAWKILDLIVSEWNSDPSSVKYFDLRIVHFRRSGISFIPLGHPSGVWSKDKQNEYVELAKIKLQNALDPF